MELDELIAILMTDEELATSRIGIVSGGSETRRIRVDSAEKVIIDVTHSNGNGPACELVFADARERANGNLFTAVRHLSRDGIFIAELRRQFAEAAARAIEESGPYWVAILGDDGVNCFVVAAMDIHPDELGPLVSDHLVRPAPPACVQLPQNRDDRRRRRLVRRHGRDRMLALATRLRTSYGEAIHRIVEGIELLIGDRPATPDVTGRRPGMFSVPGIEMEAWPNPVRWEGLKHTMDTCDRYGPPVCKELQDFVAARSLSAYVDDDYNKNKFQLADAGSWRALRLIDWRNQTSELPLHCLETRRFLSEIGGRISGEVNILRIAPMTSLPPHYDDFDCEVYIHIGLTIPCGCGIRVNGETREWQECRPLAFNPAFLHEVWNRSEFPRDVVAIDTWHPDLSETEIEALHQVRTELEILRQERQKQVRYK